MPFNTLKNTIRTYKAYDEYFQSDNNILSQSPSHMRSHSRKISQTSSFSHKQQSSNSTKCFSSVKKNLFSYSIINKNKQDSHINQQNNYGNKNKIKNNKIDNQKSKIKKKSLAFNSNHKLNMKTERKDKLKISTKRNNQNITLTCRQIKQIQHSFNITQTNKAIQQSTQQHLNIQKSCINNFNLNDTLLQKQIITQKIPLTFKNKNNKTQTQKLKTQKRILQGLKLKKTNQSIIMIDINQQKLFKKCEKILTAYANKLKKLTIENNILKQENQLLKKKFNSKNKNQYIKANN